MPDIRGEINGTCSCSTRFQNLETVLTVWFVARFQSLARFKVSLCSFVVAIFIFQFSSWNSEIAQIYPQFSLEAINKLEIIFCREISWNLYISSSTYAKYYFALRSVTEKQDFRRLDIIKHTPYFSDLNCSISQKL